jgi:hypothetical protein
MTISLFQDKEAFFLIFRDILSSVFEIIVDKWTGLDSDDNAV